jgi:hypothetical protein
MHDSVSEPLERYRRDGFAVMRGLLEKSEVDQFRQAVDRAVAFRTRLDLQPFEEKTPYGQSFLQCISLWMDSPDVRVLSFHPRIAEMAARLLGVSRVRLWHDQALYKEPGGRETEAHQDYAYWPVNEPDMVTAWIPLIDVNEESGCMGYVAGTQRNAREFVDIFRSPGAGNAFGARHAPAQFIPANRGDVIFHAAKTVHMAMPNRSKAVRAAHTVVYFRDGCTRAASSSDDAMDRNAIRPGDVIDGPATPIAWPLPDGHLPEPPPLRNATETYLQFARKGIVPAPADGG